MSVSHISSTRAWNGSLGGSVAVKLEENQRRDKIIAREKQRVRLGYCMVVAFLMATWVFGCSILSSSAESMNPCQIFQASCRRTHTQGLPRKNRWPGYSIRYVAYLTRGGPPKRLTPGRHRHAAEGPAENPQFFPLIAAGTPQNARHPST